MNETRIVLGVDGGGSKTQACIATIGDRSSAARIVGRGFAGPSNAIATSFTVAATNVTEAIRQATNVAEIELDQVNAVCLAMAGAGRESVKSSWRNWCDEQNLVNYEIVSDVSAVFAAGCQSGTGVAVISGTGSIVFGCNAMNQTARAGGWGHLISDEGSGYWIAQQALKAVVQAEDGIADATLLTAKFLEKLNTNSVKELVREVAEFDRRTWASWSSMVFQAANQDAIANDVLCRAATHLSNNVCHVARQLDLGSEFDIAMAGGVFIYNESFRSSLVAKLQRQAIQPRCTVVETPVDGAIELAIRRVQSSS